MDQVKIKKLEDKIKNLQHAFNIILEDVGNSYCCEKCNDPAHDVDSLISIVETYMCLPCYAKRTIERDEMSLAKDYIENKGGQGE